MTTEIWRERVGRAVEARRGELGISSMRSAATRARISETTWRMIESGKRQLAPGVIMPPSPERDTRLAVSRVLRWERDGIADLLEGRAPTELTRASPDQLDLSEIRAAAELILAGAEALIQALGTAPAEEPEPT